MNAKSPTDLELLRLRTSEASAWEYAAELEIELAGLREQLESARDALRTTEALRGRLTQIMHALRAAKGPHAEPHHPGCAACAAERQLALLSASSPPSRIAA